MNNRRVYFSSSGKICYKQLRKIGPFIFALISLNNLNKQLSEISDIKLNTQNEERGRSKMSEKQYVVFVLDGEYYGIDILSIQEITVDVK
jgi:hypothetical protein